VNSRESFGNTLNTQKSKQDVEKNEDLFGVLIFLKMGKEKQILKTAPVSEADREQLIQNLYLLNYKIFHIWRKNSKRNS
jgi:hypothetical protein